MGPTRLNVDAMVGTAELGTADGETLEGTREGTNDVGLLDG